MIESTLIHPMRYMRVRPFARRVTQLYSRLAGRQMLSSEGLQEVADLVASHYNQTIERLPREDRPERPTRMIVEEASLACHVGAFIEYGRNVFHVSPELVSLLDRTDLDGVRISDIRLPFTVFHISFGSAFDGSLPGPPNQIDGVYISQLQRTFLEILVTSRRLGNYYKSNNWPFSRDWYFYAPLDISNTERTFEDLLADAIKKDAVVLEPQLVGPDPDFAAEIDSRTLLVRDVRYKTAAEHAQYTAEGLPVFRQVLALAVNALCYLNATNDEERTLTYPDDAPADLVRRLDGDRSADRQKARARLLDRGFVPIYLLRESTESASLTHGRTERELSKHWRRGHWRHQAVGVGRMLRRLTWVRPTLVRADKKEPMAGHLYQMR